MSELAPFELNALPADAISQTLKFRDELTLVTSRERILEVLLHLRDVQKFEMLTDETCVDYFPQEPRFSILYQLYSISRNIRVRVKVILSEYDATLPSVYSIYENANWLEREIYDLFGIQFTDHPDLRRIMMPVGWVGHPLRREVPHKVEEVAFTFNRRRIDEGKIYAGE